MGGACAALPNYESANMLAQYKENAEEWINSVRKGDGSIIEWVMLLGIVAAVTYLWTQTIKRLVD